MANNKQIAEDVLKAVGGKGNITHITHCMTRLRFNLKDQSIPKDDEIKKIAGVLGAQISGGQYQVIIGQNVPKVYEEICNLGGFAAKTAIDENLDAPEEKQPFSLKRLGGQILDSVAGCLTPLIPVLMVAGMIKMLVAILGPTMIGVIAEESDIFRLLTFAGDAGFYFFPILIGYTGAKKFGCSPVLAMLMGGVLLHPTMLEIVNAEENFAVLGIPMTLVNYASSVIPMILITWVMSYVEKFFKKVIPDVLATVFVPLLTVLVMLPLGLCALGPAGAILGNYVNAFLVFVHEVAGPLGVALVGALYLPIVATGMHMPLIATSLMAIATFGYDNIIMPGGLVAIYADIAVGLAFFIKSKDAQNKSLGVSCLIAQMLGGVGEPTIFGILMRYKKALVWSMAGGFAGAFYIGLMNCKVYMFTASNVLCAMGYSGDSTSMLHGVIGCAITFAVTFALMMFFGYENKEKEV